MKTFIATSLFAMVALGTCEPPAPNSQYLPPGQASNSYLPPSAHQHSSRGLESPPQGLSSQYDAPAITSAIFTSPQSSYGDPSQNSGAGGYGYSGHQEENYESATYKFQYDVQDYQSGQDFGHMEAREGGKTFGRFYVLLPDGRRQIVQYEADEHGYRPIISYEYASAGQNGYFGGYENSIQTPGKLNGY